MDASSFCCLCFVFFVLFFCFALFFDCNLLYMWQLALFVILWKQEVKKNVSPLTPIRNFIALPLHLKLLVMNSLYQKGRKCRS